MIRELSAHEVNALHHELLLKDIIAAAEKLPPFPDVAWKVMTLIKKMAPIREIEELIQYDQAIAAKILRLSQSVFYGRRYGIHSLQDAILLLGNQRLLQVIIAACASRYFERSGPGRNGTARELWEHSVASALMSEILSRQLRPKKTLTVYTASLLHDIGKTILIVYAKIYLHSNPRPIRGVDDPTRAERMALGIDHQELGGIIAQAWRFPPEISAAIAHHHNPENAGSFYNTASLVYLANELAGSAPLGREKPRKAAADPKQDQIMKKYGLTRKAVEDFQAELAKELDAVRGMLAG